MKKIDTRNLDFQVIKDLCKYYSSSKCPLVFKSCNVDNCPLFIIITLKDCDIAAGTLIDVLF